MAHRRTRPFTRGKKRGNTWVAPADQATVSVSTGASAIIASFDAAANGLLNPTIVRTRGEASIIPSTFGADLTISGAFGAAIVSSDAFAAGAASIPRPFDDADWGGWYVWQSFLYRLEFQDATGVNIPASVSYQIDSKAMRKMTVNETLVFMCESQTGALGCGMHLRTLMLLG